MTLDDLITALEKAEGADREIDAWLLALSLAPKGAVVEQSKFNGAWCVYTERSGGLRLWEPPRGFAKNTDYTDSLDAIVGLIERVLPGWAWDVTNFNNHYESNLWLDDDVRACKLIPSLALSLAFARALKHKELTQ